MSADKFEAFIESREKGTPNRSGVFIRDPDDWQKVEGVRPEVLDKFAKLVQALDASPMRERAARIDNGKANGYWSRIIERAARSFENYVIANMQESGQHNDFLANVVDVNHFVRNPDRYPYLLDSEMAPVQDAFDALFQTIETRETDSGTAMFSLSRPARARTAWQPNFPKAVMSLGAKEFQKHPDYRAAKEGDIAAAVRLTKDSLKKGDMVKIKRLAQGVKGEPILVPVHAEEAVSVNQIPVAAAVHVGQDLGWDVDTGIVQAEKIGRGSGDGFYRLANQPHFIGEVEPGRSYVLLDDTLTQGGTFAALKGHIEAGGGEVIGVVAMSGKQYSSQLAPTSDTLKDLRKRWPELEGWWNEQFGYGFDKLTESEARYLARVRVSSPDALRDQILAAQQARVSRGSPPPTGRNGPLTSASIQSPEARPSAGLSASGVQESVRRAVGRHLAPSIRVVQTESDLPSGLMSSDLSGRVEGVFDPKTGQIHLVADKLASPERAAWIAWHELWHRGIRSVDGRPGKLPGSVEGGALRNAIERASLHSTVARVADGIMTERGLKSADRPIAVEEALAELNAADETGDYGQIEQRYGVRVPPGMRSGIRGHIARFLDAVRRVLARLRGRPTATVTDGEVWQIITGARDGYGGGGGPGAGRPLFSTTQDGKPDTEAARRQRSFMEGIASQPIDRMFRLPFDVAGMIDSHGRLKGGVKLDAKAREIITQWRPQPEGSFLWLDPILETVRAGLIDRYGLSDEYKQRWRETESEVRRRMGEALDLFQNTLAGMTTSEAKVFQAVMTGEKIPDSDWANVAEPVRRAIDDMGQEAVRLGLISAETYQRNRGTYLHRSYLKHESQFTGLSKFANSLGTGARRRIQGNALKARGIDAKVTMADLKRAAPDWWRTKMKAGEADGSLKGAQFILFEQLAPAGDGVEALPGVEEGGPRRRRVLARHYWPADQPEPEKYQAWENRGTWEVRGTRGDNVILWRDYSKSEREKMGEILDARYNIVKTFEVLSHDLAMGRFFADIAKNSEWFQHDRPVGGPDGEPSIIHAGEAGKLPVFAGVDWVQVPVVSVGAGDGATKWGALSGGYVRAEIWRDLNELDKMQHVGLWRAVMNQWKLNKTVRSPVTHMNNVMSNLMFMDLADVRVADLIRGVHAYVNRETEYQDALVHGTFEANFTKQELNRKVLQPILDELIKESQKDADTGTAVGLLSRLAYGIARGLKKADNTMVSAYEIEDEVFRMATYMRRLDQGDSPAEAAAAAREQFLDYDIRAPWVNAARRTVLPFISYTYRAVPVIAQSIAHRPWKLAKYYTLAYLANALAYGLAPGDEDEERRTMRDDQQGMTWFGIPRMLRMPWRDDLGNPVFLDIRRWIPAGDVFDMNQGQSAVPVPAPVQLGGAVMLAFELALNIEAFTGKQIVDHDTDGAVDVAAKVGDWAWKSWMPSAAYVPGSYYWEKAWTAAEGGRDIMGRPYSLPQAISSSVGVKVQPHDVRLGYTYRAWDLNGKLRKHRRQARQLGSDLNRGLISQESYGREMARLKKKLERLEVEAKRLQGRE